MPGIVAAPAAATASPEVEGESVETDSGAAGSVEGDSGVSPAEQQAAHLAGNAPEGEEPAAEPPKPQKYKLDDEEFDEAELREWRATAQKRKEHTTAANKKFEEAAALRAEAAKERAEYQRQLAALQKDPWAVHRANGYTDEQINALSYQHLSEQARLQDLQKADPQRYQAEREFQQLQAQLQAARDEKAQHEQWVNQQRHAQQVKQHESFIEQQLPAAVEKAGFKGNPEAAWLTQNMVVAQLQAGQEPDFEGAAETVKDLLHGSAKSYVANLSPEALLKEFPDLVKKLREASVARVAKSPGVKPAPATQRPQPKPNSNEPFDREEFFRRAKRGEFDSLG